MLNFLFLSANWSRRTRPSESFDLTNWRRSWADVITGVGNRHLYDRETYHKEPLLNDRTNPLIFTPLILRAMGACSSCCKNDASPERELLLPRSGPQDRDETATRYTDKIADVVGALEAGRLPSQAQIDHAFRNLLNSDLLKVESANAHLPPSLKKELVVILDDVKEVVVAMLEVGSEKNGSLPLILQSLSF